MPARMHMQQHPDPTPQSAKLLGPQQRRRADTRRAYQQAWLASATTADQAAAYGRSPAVPTKRVCGAMPRWTGRMARACRAQQRASGEE
eukprot:scaffold255608_cov33-Tisochrysis_lutea.AAC.2